MQLSPFSGKIFSRLSLAEGGGGGGGRKIFPIVARTHSWREGLFCDFGAVDRHV